MPRDPIPSPEDRRPMARPRPASRRRAAWIALSALLHLAALALLLVTPRPEGDGGDGQPSYEVVFANPAPGQPAPDQPAPDTGTDRPAPPVPPDPDAQPGARPPAPPPDAAPPQPAPPEPVPPEPAPPAPPEPPPPQPAPPEPEAPPAAPRPSAPPSIRLAEPDLPEPMQLPPPVPIPDAPPPPRQAAPPRPRPRQQQAERFPAPIDLNFGPAAPARPAPGSIASRAVDLSLGPAKPGSLRAASSDLQSPNASADLMAALQAWWRQHRYYPEQARRAGEDGSVGIRLQVDRHGKVVSAEMQNRSGSQWLDMAALGTFRGARLLVPSNAGQTVSVDLTIHYLLIRH